MNKFNPCPFCGLSDVYIRTNWTTPTMGRHPRVISVEGIHHCPGESNKVFNNVRSIRAVDEETLIEAWNKRYDNS